MRFGRGIQKNITHAASGHWGNSKMAQSVVRRRLNPLTLDEVNAQLLHSGKSEIQSFPMSPWQERQNRITRSLFGFSISRHGSHSTLVERVLSRLYVYTVLSLQLCFSSTNHEKITEGRGS